MTNRLTKAAGLGLLVLGSLKLNDSFARDRAEIYTPPQTEVRQVEEVSPYEEASQGLPGDLLGLGCIFGGAYMAVGEQRRKE
ncbi:MAG: hypothetical protein KJ718_06545 [Nanoarchaeota archaeon]|nr:hypothetical protein [Nanoarchaeota archaeon]MBU1052177.1 hypothetical protein [Nanoarchaeota archaeon]MBU1988589.1 hypothetical protein [Nanoarchaeota archaeon]